MLYTLYIFVSFSYGKMFIDPNSAVGFHYQYRNSFMIHQ